MAIFKKRLIIDEAILFFLIIDSLEKSIKNNRFFDLKKFNFSIFYFKLRVQNNKIYYKKIGLLYNIIVIQL